MEYCILTRQSIAAFGAYLRMEERAPGTVEKYQRDLNALFRWLDGRQLSREEVARWKEYLLSHDYQPRTINSMLAALNSYFRFQGWDCRAKFLKVQRAMFRDPSRELTRREYDCLIETAERSGQERLARILETLGATGIRVSELRYITVEAAREGRAEISLKGKIRTILLSGKLCRKLLKYAHRKKISSGEIFITGGGKSLSRKQVWSEMKKLCLKAGVAPSKVFPHNLRHLFATVFLQSVQGYCEAG